MAGTVGFIIIKNNDGSIQLSEHDVATSNPLDIVDTGVQYNGTMIYTYSGNSTFLGLSISPNQTVPDENLTVGSSVILENIPTNTFYIVDSKEAVSSKGEFLGYIVSDNINEYPSDGEQNGYYYEKVIEEQVTIDGVKVKEKLDLIKRNALLMFDLLPYQCMNSRAVTYNDEIHLFGGGTSDNNSSNRHLVWDGNSWSESTPIPRSTNQNAVTVYRNGIHLLPGYYDTYHYRWNGTSWTYLTSLPWDNNYGTALVYKDELHLFTTLSSDTSEYRHYKWDGSSWTYLGNIPIPIITNKQAIVYNEEIYITNGKSLYKWNESSWTDLGAYMDKNNTYYGNLFVSKDNKLHYLYGRLHYVYDGTSWIRLDDIFYSPSNYGDITELNGAIHMLGGSTSLIQAEYHCALSTDVYEVKEV